MYVKTESRGIKTTTNLYYLMCFFISFGEFVAMSVRIDFPLLLFLLQQFGRGKLNHFRVHACPTKLHVIRLSSVNERFLSEGTIVLQDSVDHTSVSDKCGEKIYENDFSLSFMSERKLRFSEWFCLAPANLFSFHGDNAIFDIKPQKCKWSHQPANVWRLG